MDIERLAFSDFFSANPFLIFESNEAERRELILAGFDSRTLSYQSSAQRFSNRRQRLQHDLAWLLSYGLIAVEPAQGRLAYNLTQRGADSIPDLRSLYALSFVESARLVTKKLNRLSDKRLREQAKTWLRAETLMIDLYDVESPHED